MLDSFLFSDHTPTGAKHPARKAIQLGLKRIKPFINGDYIVDIQDITDFVLEQREFVLTKDYDKLMVPIERVYTVETPELSQQLRIGQDVEPAGENEIDIESSGVVDTKTGKDEEAEGESK